MRPSILIGLMPALVVTFSSASLFAQAPSQAPAPQVEEEPLRLPGADLYLAPIVGGNVRLKSWDLSEVPDGGETQSRVWPVLGARFGGTMFSFLSLDAEIAYMTYLSKGGGRNHALSYRASAQVNLLPASRWSPFAVAGIGLYQGLSGDLGKDLDMRTDYGAGVRYLASERVKLRADVRHVFTDGVGDYALGHNLEVLLSTEFLLWYPIQDEDDDGIRDSRDLCPMDPGPALHQGCPDTDGDGLIDAEDRCVKSPGPRESRGCPDTDGDTLFDPEDSCPRLAGPVSLGGCPMPDTDKDGLLDDQDVCPDAPEDKDGFEDEDGCPDYDNDGDGIADKDDKCPLVPESLNGFQDRDGCPEDDQDGDAIVDGSDACPTQAETVNQFLDGDGCPDTLPPEVVSIEAAPLEGLFFSGKGEAELDVARSRVALDRLQTLFTANPGLRLDLAVFVESKGGDGDARLYRSRHRAENLRKYFMSKGIKSEHIQAQGAGEVPSDASKAAQQHGHVVVTRF